jgi:hypothetical protein
VLDARGLGRSDRRRLLRDTLPYAVCADHEQPINAGKSLFKAPGIVKIDMTDFYAFASKVSQLTGIARAGDHPGCSAPQKFLDSNATEVATCAGDKQDLVFE